MEACQSALLQCEYSEIDPRRKATKQSAVAMLTLTCYNLGKFAQCKPISQALFTEVPLSNSTSEGDASNNNFSAERMVEDCLEVS